MSQTIKFKQFLSEQVEKHASVFYGRGNPLHKGHEGAVEKTVEIAKKNNGEAHVILTRTHDSKKNPLTPEQKLKHAKRAFSHTGAKISVASEKHPTILHQASSLHSQGVTHLHLVAGQDRINEFHKLLHKYNGVKGENHYYKFKHIEIHSSGDRDPDAEGTEGMSASKMRKHAENGNKDEFIKNSPSGMTPEHKEELYKDTRSGLGLKKEHIERKFNEFLVEGVFDQGINHAVFLVGGPGSGKDYIMNKTLQGHGAIEINSDKAFSHLMDKEKLDKKMPDSEENQRNEIRKKAKSTTELREKLAILGRNGLIINGNGSDADKIQQMKTHLENMGYKSKMLFVHADNEVSRERNIKRGQRGNREVPEKIRQEKWDQTNSNKESYKKMFGPDHYHEIDNSSDLSSPSSEVERKKQEHISLSKKFHEFFRTPSDHPAAQKWVYNELEKRKKLSVQRNTNIAPPQGSDASQQAKKFGLNYAGGGIYRGNKNKTFGTVNDKIVPLKESYFSDDNATNLLSLGKKLEENHLVGILRHPEHGKVYIWHKGIPGAYGPYEVEHTKSGKKQTFDNHSHEEIVNHLVSKGYKFLGESKNIKFKYFLGERDVQNFAGKDKEIISESTTTRTENFDKKNETEIEESQIIFSQFRKKINNSYVDIDEASDEYIQPPLGTSGEKIDKNGKATSVISDENKKKGKVSGTIQN